MRAWSFGLGRWFGVEVRLHAVLLLLLGVAVGATPLSGGSASRGLALWLILLFSLALREIARSLAAAWLGLDLRALLLLPTGALPTIVDPTERLASTSLQLQLAWVGPAANLLAGAALGGLLLSASPTLDLGHHPWVTGAHPLRALIWVNLSLGALHLLPAAPLDAGRVLRAAIAARRGVPLANRTALTVTHAVVLAVAIAGGSLGSAPLMLTAAAVLFAVAAERPELAVDGAADTVLMRDIMLVDFTTLSASDTLEEALDRAIHVSQDVFPVVRGSTVVGAVSRQGIVDALTVDGNGYIQGLMARTLSITYPEDSLMKVLSRLSSSGGAQLLPVVEGDRLLGIVTPQHLTASMRLLTRRRRWRAREARSTR